jgi:hypothetical protein
MTMTIQRTQKIINSTKVVGVGFVMFGFLEDASKWFERWFPSAEAAQVFAEKRGWKTEVAEGRRGN